MHIGTRAEAELQRLATAARAARSRTATLRVAAGEQLDAAAGWQRRVELMEASHQPLSQAQEAEREREEARLRRRAAVQLCEDP